MMRAHDRYALALAIMLAADARSAWPQDGLDAGTIKLYGGTYLSDCRNPASPRVTVLEDTLVFIQGDKRISGSIVLNGISYFGERPPENFRATLEGEHPSGQHLYLLVFSDAKGPYITIDADQKLLGEIGKSALALKYRRCDAPAKRASAAPVPAPIVTAITPAEPLPDTAGVAPAAAFNASAGKPLDIAGIRLGMPMKEALDVLRAHAAEAGKHGVVMPIEPAEIKYDVLTNPMRWGARARASDNTETIFIVFSMPPNAQVVTEVHRNLAFARQPPARDVILASLAEKYGPESYKQEFGDFGHHWFFKDGRQLFFANAVAAGANGECTVSVGGLALGQPASAEWVSERIAFGFQRDFRTDLGKYCGAYVIANVNYAGENKELVSNLRVTIADLTMEAGALERTRTYLEAAAAAKRREEVEKAKLVPKTKL